MASLEYALRKLSNSFGRNGEDTGELLFVGNTDVPYPSSLPSCPELHVFYRHLKLNKAGIGGSLMLDLYSPDQLEKSQIGWRWKRNKDGTTQVNPDWNPCYVVIGDRNGDALAVNTDEVGGPIYGFIQGASILLACSLQAFFDVYSEWMQCEYSEFNMDVKDENFNIDSIYLDRLSQIATAKLGEIEVRGLFEYFFG